MEKKQKKRPTIRDLAGRLRVSHTTVSLALRNNSSIPLRTRKRVQAMARKMGYQSNLLVSALLSQVRQGRLRNEGEVVALLTALPADEWQSLPSVRAGMAQATSRASQLGLRMEVFFMGLRGENSGQVARVLENRGYRALLLPPLPTSMAALNIDWGRFAVVALGYSFSQADPHRVANAHFNGIVTCYQKLRERGCRRIGLVLRRDDDDRARHYWLSGFLGASMVHGGEALPPLLTGFEMDRDVFFQWLESTRPDAIISMSRDVLLGWLAQQHIVVPGQLRYACLDVLNGATHSLAGIRQSWGEIFSTGIELLAGQLSRNEIGLPAMPKVTLIDGAWVEGATA